MSLGELAIIGGLALLFRVLYTRGKWAGWHSGREAGIQEVLDEANRAIQQMANECNQIIESLLSESPVVPMSDEVEDLNRRLEDV
jgi:hypothetical protein